MRRSLLAVLAAALLTQAASAAAPPPAGFVCGDKRVRVERFVPKGKGPFPAVVLLHGLDGLDERGDLYRTLAQTAASKGYVAVLVHYFDRTGTTKDHLPGLMNRFRDCLDDTKVSQKPWQSVESTFNAWLEAVAGAVTDTRKHPLVDPDRVGLVGFSMGGFLATSAASRPELKIRCVVTLFGGLPRPLLGHAAHLPPALLIHGDRDEVVPAREATSLAALLKKAGRECDLKVYPGVGHGIDPSKGWITFVAAMDAQCRALSFLSRHLSQTRRDRVALAPAAEVGPPPARDR